MSKGIGLVTVGFLVTVLVGGCGAETVLPEGEVGVLEPGIYRGHEDCQLEIRAESQAPVVTASPRPLLVAVTRRGNPMIDGVVLQVGAILTRPLERLESEIELTVTDYQVLPNGEVVVEMNGEGSLCVDHCEGATGNGLCEEPGGSSEICRPGTDCADCQSLPPVLINVRETVHYTQPQSDQLHVHSDITVELSRPVINLEIACNGQIARGPH